MITNRRKFLHQAATTAGLALMPWNPIFARLLNDEPPYKMREIRNRVGVFSERGGTIGYLISDSGIVVIDSQFPEQAGHLIEEVKKRSEKKIDLLINTHHHGDHSSGNIAFKGLVNKVVAHENSRANQMRVAKERNTEAEQLYPDTLYSDSWSHRIGEETISMKYFGPAHTDGDSVIHFENANVVHVGDLMFNRRHPFIDKSAGASIENWINVLSNIRSAYDDDTIFIFGHARDTEKITGNKRDLQAMENYLSRLLEVVSKNLKAGKSKEEILQLTDIPGADEWQGGGIERPLTAAFEELTGEQ